jgi:hypothetical protein
MQKGSGIILSGNRQLAATFVKISKKKLYDMKQMMRITGQSMMQRIFYLDRDCVHVRIYIIDNAEFIRIHACSEGADCELSMSVEPLGSNQAEITATHKSDEESANYSIYYDVGGIYLTGGSPAGLRYSISNFSSAELGVAQTKTITFLAPGDYTISAFAQPNQNLVSHSTGVISVAEYEVDMDLTGISAASVVIAVLSLGNDPVECYINDVLVGTTQDGTNYNNTIIVQKPTIQDTMNMRFVALGLNIRQVSIIFRPYNCQPVSSSEVTIT